MWWRRAGDEPLALRALHVVMAFGPERRRPEFDRLREIAPEASGEEIKEAIEGAHAIESRAYQLTAPAWCDQRLEGDAFREVSREASASLLAEYPFLPKRTISRLVSQAHYFHSK